MQDCLYVRQARARGAAAALATSMSRRLAERQNALAACAGRLNALSPLATLERGYAVARGEHGATLTSSTQFSEGQAFTLRLRDGEVDACGATAAGAAPMTLEQTLARLEEIVRRLDEERLDLGDALALFEEGVAHLRDAAGALSEADARVKRLTEQADGAFTLEDLDG